MTLSPIEAASRINELITVEMLVKAAKNCAHCSQDFLDSEQDHHDPKNLAVAVTEIGKARFKEMRIDDPAGHYESRVIRVTGVVTLKESRLRIEVERPQANRSRGGKHVTDDFHARIRKGYFGNTWIQIIRYRRKLPCVSRKVF